jgi:hypothetical protein
MRTSIVLMALLGALAIPSPIVLGAPPADPVVAPPNSVAYGKSLGEWLEVYWTWYSSGELPDTGRVLLLPLPQGIYDIGTGSFDDPYTMHGDMEISVRPGTPFVLPIMSWIGERYEGWPAVPDDSPFPDEWFGTYITADVTLDGRPILEDFTAYYVPVTYFGEPVAYPYPTDYGSVAAVFFQGVGFVCNPLPVGVHTITNDVYILIPPEDWTLWPGGYGVIYHNSWTITVGK